MSESLDAPVENTEPTFNLDVDLSQIDSGASTPPSGGDGINPVWNSVLATVPKEFHGRIIPEFRNWDAEHQRGLAKAKEEAIQPYVPYQQFIDQKIQPQELLAAHAVLQRINSDPLDVYNRLGAMLRQEGLLTPEETPAPEEEEEQQFRDPRVDELARQQKALMDSINRRQQEIQQQQEIARFAQETDKQVQSEFAELARLTGASEVPEWLRVELMQRASLMMDQLGRPVSIKEAFQNFQQMRAEMQRIAPYAPKVPPSGGGFPQTPPDPDKLNTMDGRAAAVKEIIDSMRTNS